MLGIFQIQMWKDIKGFYEQLVRLRMHKKYAVSVAPARKIILMSSNSYDVCEHFDGSFGGASPSEVLLVARNPMNYPGTDRAVEYANKWSAEYAADKDLKSSYQNRADGFRHAVWNALICRETGTQFDNVNDCLDWSKKFTDAHESCNIDGELAEIDESMDLHNNGIGREKYRQYLSVGCELSLPIIGCINHEVNGPSREDTKQMFRTFADNGKGFNDKSQLEKSPWAYSIVYLKPDTSIHKIYCRVNQTPTKGDCIEFENPITDYVKIGVLKKNPAVCNDEISFYLDLEDYDNKSRIISGDRNPAGISLSDGGVTFTYCKVNVDGEYGTIPKVPYDYVVLRLSEHCPVGTYPFRRYHDTEDEYNNNSFSGYIWPNVVNSNASLEYCFVPADENSVLEFPFEDDYGIFANVSSGTLIHSQIKLDDEDDYNNNTWERYETPVDILNRAKNIIDGSANTIYNAVSYIVIVFNTVVDFFFG